MYQNRYREIKQVDIANETTFVIIVLFYND